MTKEKLIGLICLLIPLLALGAMAGLEMKKSTTLPSYHLPIRGFDPRDILRGHYLIFDYAWPENAKFSCEIEKTKNEYSSFVNIRNCCACLSGDSKSPTISLQPCSSGIIQTNGNHPSKNTSQAASGHCAGSEIFIGEGYAYAPDNKSEVTQKQMIESLRIPYHASNRFYIPEAEAQQIEKALMDGQDQFKIEAFVTPNGRLRPKELFINGKSLNEWLE
jgi:uncharacterized membrane-anchored protein